MLQLSMRLKTEALYLTRSLCVSSCSTFTRNWMRKAESSSSSLLVMNNCSGFSSNFSLTCLPLHRPWDPGDDNLSVPKLYYFRRFHLIAALLLKLHVLMVEGLEEYA